MEKFRIDDYTKGVDQSLVRTGSPIHDFPFTDSLAFDQQFETDSQPVLTAGLFRTSRGPDRVQLSAFNPDGEQIGGLYVFQNGKEVVGLYRDFLDFFDPTTGHSGSIGLVGDDLQLISTDGNIVLDVEDGTKNIVVTQTILPSTTNYADLGSPTFSFKNAYLTGSLIANIDIIGSVLGVADGITPPATVLGFGLIYIDVSDGDLKIKFGDGTIKTIVTD